jgi:lysyl-tRNA synthetase class I
MTNIAERAESASFTALDVKIKFTCPKCGKENTQTLDDVSFKEVSHSCGCGYDHGHTSIEVDCRHCKANFDLGGSF